MKNKETLEEAAENFFNNSRFRSYKTFFCEGAKWQAERMYSEEEARNIAEWSFSFYRRNDLSDSELEDEFNRILNEQFKKK